MRIILLLLFVTGFSASAQEGWVNYPIDHNVEVLFPGKPTVDNTLNYRSADYELPGLNFQFVEVKYNPDSGKQVTNTDQLKSLYQWVLETRITASGGTIESSSHEMQRDIMMGTARYKPPGSNNACEVRLLFVKRRLYSFSSCAMEGNLEFEEKSKIFFNSITINKDLTPEDQFTAVNPSPLSPRDPSMLFGIFYILLILTWVVVLVIVTFKTRGGASPAGLLKLFSIVRWTLVGLSLLLTSVMVIATVGSRFEGRGDYNTMAIVGGIFLVISLAALFLKPAVPSNPGA